MTAQTEIFGPGGGVSDTTMLRILDEVAARLNTAGPAAHSPLAKTDSRCRSRSRGGS